MLTAPAAERVLVRGELECIEERERRAHGIPINQLVYDDLAALGRELEIPFV